MADFIEAIKDFFTGAQEQELPSGAVTEPQLPQGAVLISDLQRKATKNLPAGAAVIEPEGPTVTQKITARFLGTDVDDPLEMPRLGAILTGAVAGGMAGSRVPRLPGPAGLVVNPITGMAVGGAIGTGVGAVAPETAIEFGESIGAVEPGTRARIGLSPEELRTLLEGEVLLDLATGGAISAARLTGRGVGKLLTGSGKAEAELAERAAAQDIHLMPVQLGDRSIGRGYVAIMGRFPLLGTRIVEHGRKAEEAIQKAFQNAADRISPIIGHSDLSRKIYDDATNLVSQTNRAFKKRYEDLFQKADEIGVTVVPRETLDKADEVLKKLASQTPVSATGEPTSVGKSLNAVQEFLENEVLVMRQASEGGVLMARQNLRQMDGLISKIDQELASLEPKQRKFASSLLNQVRQAAQKDVLVNVRGEGSGEVARALRELDLDFSHTMSSIFETATAKRFGSVEKRGLRGVAFDKTTRTPVDKLSRIVVKLDSPQAIEELHRLVTPETFKQVAAQVIDDAVSTSMVKTADGLKRFDVEAFARNLGLDKPLSPQRKVVGKMLELAGSPATVDELQTLVEAGMRIASLDIPNVSSFIARRATIGGLKSVINAFVPGAALVSGAHLAGGTLLATAMFVGGGRLVSSVIANPNTARALKNVLGEEAKDIVKRKAMVQVLRGGVLYMKERGDFGAGEMAGRIQTQLNEVIDLTMDALDRQMQELRQ